MSSSSGLRFEARTLLCGCVVAVTIWFGGRALSSRLEAQSAVAPASFTVAQADRGKALYGEQCASCHGPNLDDGAFGPPLKGTEFRQKWGATTLEPLFTYTSTKMPPGQPGTLGDASYALLLAYMLQENGVRPGATALSGDADALKAMTLPGGRGGGGGGGGGGQTLAAGVVLPPAPARINPLDTMRPVTDAMLTSPADGEWLLWRRTYDAAGFSPLKTINRGNVAELRVAWSLSLPNGPNQATPLVHDGVMFVHSYGDRVQAVDAVTGDLLWQYSRRLPQGVAAEIKRSISIYGSRLYVGTSDAHVVALDAKTGKVVWDRTIGDSRAGIRITGGPLVARGKVMVGTRGTAKGGNYIVALDTDTGVEAWRFYTIARPDEPGGNSWNNLPLEQRNGGSVWIPGSYDPVTNLAFFGAGNTYDTGPLRDRVPREGVTNDGLYLDTTIALSPDTGKLVWYFQHQPNGQWDLDWAFERQVVQLRVNNAPKSVVITGGKQMIFDVTEAATGKYVTSLDLTRELGLQNIVTAIDPKTGAKTIDPKLVPGDGETKMVCPSIYGGRDWMPSAYDAAAKMLYIPWVEACNDWVPVPKGERGMLSTGVRAGMRPSPFSDGTYGRLQAVNLETKRTVWIDRQRAPLTAGVLATAGGLVFTGGLDRMFVAHDALTGAVLWKTRLNDNPSSTPMSYAVNGRQYIAMVVSAGNSGARTTGIFVPEMANMVDHAAAIWVFEIPPKTAAQPRGAAQRPF